MSIVSSQSFEHVNNAPPQQPIMVLRLPQFSLWLTERKVLLTVGDLLVINIMLALSLAYRGLFTLSFANLGDHLVWFLLFSGLWATLGEILRIYDLNKAAHSVHSIWSVGITGLLTTIFYTLIPVLSPNLPERRVEILFFPLFIVGGVMLWRWLYATLIAQPNFYQTALVIGTDWVPTPKQNASSSPDDQDINNLLLNHKVGYQVLGFIDSDPQKSGVQLAGVPVLGGYKDIPYWIQKLMPSQLVLALPTHSPIPAELLSALLECRSQGVSVITLTQIHEELTSLISINYAAQDVYSVLTVEHSGMHRLYLTASRLLDLLVGFLGCLGLLLLIPFVWLANYWLAPGPLFYRQERVGKGGKPFYILKFRSMVVDAEKFSGAVWAVENDPRITPIGHFLRRSRLDEIPQFWNILRGDMALIGPRPERPRFVQELAEQISFYPVRHAVKPGLTGWAQVMYRYGASVEDALMKLQYDLYYIKHQSLFIDLQIMLRTIGVIVGLKGR